MRNLDCNSISRDIWGFCQEKNLWLYAVHIAGVDNSEADHESRIKANTEWELPQEVFNRLDDDLGPFEIDLFASRLAHKLDKYASWIPDPFAAHIDAFSFDWKKYKCFAFPPFSLILKVTRKVLQENAQGLILTPYWTTQPWLPRLRKVAKLHRLGKTTLTNPVDGSQWHLDLAAWVI